MGAPPCRSPAAMIVFEVNLQQFPCRRYGQTEWDKSVHYTWSPATSAASGQSHPVGIGGQGSGEIATQTGEPSQSSGEWGWARTMSKEGVDGLLRGKVIQDDSMSTPKSDRMI
ncbi:hypothetical protein chiPu_0027424 [Chiloscyllium punctatum]|uniref:Uncharacterized protein n=1 Tax=Chiloscyllium punctatum TaxID=137246 RepID=A0A401TLN2_CHIPU|nr:hypothetical protein [Chiloscyllium punctatum]